jgi:hypothetical protein
MDDKKKYEYLRLNQESGTMIQLLQPVGYVIYTLFFNYSRNAVSYSFAGTCMYSLCRRRNTRASNSHANIYHSVINVIKRKHSLSRHPSTTALNIKLYRTLLFILLPFRLIQHTNMTPSTIINGAFPLILHRLICGPLARFSLISPFLHLSSFLP